MRNVFDILLNLAAIPFLAFFRLVLPRRLYDTRVLRSSFVKHFFRRLSDRVLEIHLGLSQDVVHPLRDLSTEESELAVQRFVEESERVRTYRTVVQLWAGAVAGGEPSAPADLARISHRGVGGRPPFVAQT